MFTKISEHLEPSFGFLVEKAVSPGSGASLSDVPDDCACASIKLSLRSVSWVSDDPIYVFK